MVEFGDLPFGPPDAQRAGGIDGVLTSHLGTIHEEFAKEWKKVYFRLEKDPPDYDKFKERYGSYIL